MFKGCIYMKHTNPIKEGKQGFILNKEGHVIAFVKLDGSIISIEREFEHV